LIAEEDKIGFTSFLSEYVSEHKRKLIELVLAKRTRFLTVVLEDMYHSHNASAVVRSCDCFGIQDVHVIEDRNKYNVNHYVVQGSAKWIDINKYTGEANNKVSCFTSLKASGYRLVGTSPDSGSMCLQDYKLEGKTALIFGNEETGLSNEAKDMIDDMIHIPMSGFTESLNVSVSAAICLHDLTSKLLSSEYNWQLTDNEKDEIRLDWYSKIVRKSDALEREFLRIKENTNSN